MRPLHFVMIGVVAMIAGMIIALQASTTSRLTTEQRVTCESQHIGRSPECEDRGTPAAQYLGYVLLLGGAASMVTAAVVARR